MKKRTLTAQNRRKQLPSENKELSTQFPILHVSFIYVTLHSSAVLPVELVSVKQNDFPPPALLSEFSYRPTFYFNAGISARTSSATRFAAGPSSGQKAVSCAGVLQLLQMFLLLFHCPGHERVGALTALELRAGEYRAKNPKKYTIHSLIFLFVCLTFVSSQRRLTLWELTNFSPES